MSKIFKIALCVMTIICASITYIFIYREKIPVLIQDVSQSLGLSKPCTKPITYSLVFFDNRFGISKQQFEDDISKAASIWENSLDRKLFSFEESGGELDMNLIYDYRQQATSQMDQVDSTIKSDQTTYDMLKTKYGSLQTAYSQGKSSLQQAISAYEARKTSYDGQVDLWNQKGGAPIDQFKALEQDRIYLNTEAASINQRQKSLNSMVDDINSTASILNRLANALNINVKTYNTIGKITGEEFSEGEYIEDPSGKRVNIYQFKDEDQLIRVLEHELGHALGLEHVTDSKAIMYRLNEGTNQRLTDDDAKELDRVCEVGS